MEGGSLGRAINPRAIVLCETPLHVGKSSLSTSVCGQSWLRVTSSLHYDYVLNSGSTLFIQYFFGLTIVPPQVGVFNRLQYLLDPTIVPPQVGVFNRLQYLLDPTIVSMGFAHWLAGTRIDGNWGRQMLGFQIRFVPDLSLVGENIFWGSGNVHLSLDYDHFVDAEGKVVICSILQKSRFPNGFGTGNLLVVHPRNYASNLLVGNHCAAGTNLGQFERGMNACFDLPGRRTLLGNPVMEIGSKRLNQVGSPGAADALLGNPVMEIGSKRLNQVHMIALATTPPSLRPPTSPHDQKVSRPCPTLTI